MVRLPKTIRRLRCLVMSAVLLWPLLLVASPLTEVRASPFDLSELPGPTSLSRYIRYLEDPEGSLRIEEARASTEWRPNSSAKNPGFGFTDSVYWIHISVSNPGAKDIDWLLQQEYPLIDVLTLYERTPAGDWGATVTGDSFPFAARPLEHRTFVFPVHVAAGATADYYLRFQTASSMNIVLKAATPDAFRVYDDAESAVLWMYYGIMVVMFFYNFFVFVAMRSLSHLYFIVHAFFLLIFVTSVSGVAYQYFWPGFPYWANVSLPVSLGILAAALLQFARYFLKLADAAPWFDRIFAVLAALCLIGGVLGFIVPYRSSIFIVATLAGISTLLGVGIAIPYLAIVKKSRQARIALSAFIVFLVGTFLMILRVFGVLASNPLTEFGYQVGSALALVVLSYGLADQINVLRAELACMNAMLEDKVRARTADLEHARIQAENANRAKSDFLANMSHEIRTPMNAILGMSELIAGKGDDSQEREKYLGVLQSAGRNLLGLIDDILDLSRVEAGRVGLEIRDVDVSQLLESVIDMFAMRAKEKGLNLELQLQPEARVLLRSDAARLRQILINLVGNAIKFTRAGVVRVHAGRDPADSDRLRISVTDSGPGIEREHQTIIFDAFAQADSSTTRKFGGTGLGLAISRQLAELLGGELQLQSTPGAGSCFYVSLPTKTQHVEGGAGDSSPLSESSPIENEAGCTDEMTAKPRKPSISKKLKILLVEDNPDNQLLIQAYLRGTTWEVDVAANGLIGLKCFRSGRYDLILMDIQMPVMDGYAATRRIRELEEVEGWPATPILALTAHAMKEASTESLASGCNGHLTKPINKTDLRAAVLEYAHPQKRS